MKKTFKVLGWVLRIVLAVLILLFSVATLMGGSYLQTALLWLAVLFVLWWPGFLSMKKSPAMTAVLRIGVIGILLAVNFTAFAPGPKTSIYLSEGHRKVLMDAYDMRMGDWPADTESLYLDTEWGKVHVLVRGDRYKPPIVMIHAASMGAHSWADNLEPLLPFFRIYAIDNIGEGNRSRLKDAAAFPPDGRAIADLYAEIFNQLGISGAPVLGASNGGYVAQVLAYYHPDKVKCLALFGPMGVTPLTAKSVMMLSIASMYPFQFVRDRVTRWALGDDAYTRRVFRDWFQAILEGTMPSVAMPEPMTTEQKKAMTMPVLLFLGTRDPIVGDAATAAETAGDYPDIEITILDSGHIVAVEHRETVNPKLVEFLKKHGCLPPQEPSGNSLE